MLNYVIRMRSILCLYHCVPNSNQVERVGGPPDEVELDYLLGRTSTINKNKNKD